jgi:hypothetical protein
VPILTTHHVTHDHHEHPEPGEDLAPGKLAYADAMAGVHPRHPDDLDVAGLYADAMMNLAPWQLWKVATASRRHERAHWRSSGCWSRRSASSPGRSISEPTAVTDSTSTATIGAGWDEGEPPGLMRVGRLTVAPGP